MSPDWPKSGTMKLLMELCNITWCKKRQFYFDVYLSCSYSTSCRYNTIFMRMSVGGRETKLPKKGSISKPTLQTNSISWFWHFVYFIAELLISLLLNISVFDTNMVPTRKKKYQKKKLRNQINKSSNDFITDSNTNVDAADNGTLEPQASWFDNIFGRSTVAGNNARNDQVIERKIADRFKKETENAVTGVENWVHDAILTTKDNVIKPRVEMAARPMTGSSGRRPNSVTQNLDQSVFSGDMENTRSRRLLAGQIQTLIKVGMMRLVMLKISRTVTFRHSGLILSGNRTLITRSFFNDSCKLQQGFVSYLRNETDKIAVTSEQHFVNF